MTDLATEIKAAMGVQVQVRIVGEGDAFVSLYSGGESGHTVITHHRASEGVSAIVASHLAKRTPKAQKKSRQIATRVHHDLYGGR